MFNLNFLNKNTALLAIAVVGIIVIGVLVFANNSGGNFSFFGIFGSSSEKIAQKAVDYINNNGLSSTPASLVSFSEESGLIKIKIKIGPNEFDSYVTKDGKLLFPQVINMGGSNLGEGDENQLSESSDQQQSIRSFSITRENHILGNFDAPITLVEFSDFQCSFCARLYPTLKKIEQDYKGKVRLVYKHFLLSFQYSQKAAEASECAAEQGKFWEYHDKLFENAQDYSVDNFKKWAKELGLNSEKFNNCLDSEKFVQKIQADSQEGREKGVSGTPATFINGQLVSGAQPYESFKEIIDSLLSQ